MTLQPPPLPDPNGPKPAAAAVPLGPLPVYAAAPPRRSVFGSIFRFFVGSFAILGLLVALLFGSLIALAVAAGERATRVEDRSVLYIDFEKPIPDEPSRGLLAQLQPQPTLQDTVEAIRAAAGDPRVVALVGRFGEQVLTLSQAQELAPAIQAFTAAGKRSVAYSESFSEAVSSRADVYLASAFYETYLQPEGQVGLSAHAAELVHGADALAQLDIRWEGGRREEYKTANDAFVESRPRPEEIENLNALIGDLDRQLFDGIASNRQIDAAGLRSLVADRFPADSEAVTAGLVDNLMGYHALRRDLANLAGGTITLLGVQDYRTGAAERFTVPDTAPTIAVLHAGGMILRRSDEGGFGLSDNTVTDARRMESAVTGLLNDNAVQAVVLRVDSPGGSVIGSETVRQAVDSLRSQRALPIVSSFGSVAASGGYWIATATDRIVANPATITGSIGVVVGRPYIGAALEKIGLHITRVGPDEGPAGMFSLLHSMTPGERATLDRMLDRIYGTFVRHVATARGKTEDEARAVAKGRVYTGDQALQLGLVDELGGLEVAILAAKKAANIPANAPVKIVHYPQSGDPLQELLGGGSEIVRGTALLAQFGRGLESFGVLGPRAAPQNRMLAMPDGYGLK